MEQIKKSQSKKEFRIPDFAFQAIVALLACISAVCFRPSMGLVRMFPIPLLCMTVSALLPVKFWQRAAFFLSVALALNVIETEELGLLAVTMAGYIVLFVLAELAAFLFRKKKLLPIAAGILPVLAALLVSSFLFGNPISAKVADRRIDEYMNRIYDMESGDFRVTEIEYDYRSRTYAKTVSSGLHPTEPGAILYRSGILTDGYLPILEAQYQSEALVKITKAMRAVSQNDQFHVLSLGIGGFPGQQSLLRQDYDEKYDESMSFCVQLSGRTDLQKLKNSALQYSDVLAGNRLSFGKICFTGYNSVKARSLFGVIPTDFDGISYHSVRPVLCVRTYGFRYSLKEDPLTDFLWERFVSPSDSAASPRR